MNKKKLSILYFEKSYVFQQTLSEFLKDSEYSLTIEESKDATIAAFKKNRHDIVLTSDSLGAFEDSQEIAEVIKKLDTNQPILTLLEDAKKASKMKQVDCIKKPIIQNDLIGKIESYAN